MKYIIRSAHNSTKNYPIEYLIQIGDDGKCNWRSATLLQDVSLRMVDKRLLTMNQMKRIVLVNFNTRDELREYFIKGGIQTIDWWSDHIGERSYMEQFKNPTEPINDADDNHDQ